MKIIKKVLIVFAILVMLFGVGQSFAVNTQQNNSTVTTTNTQNNTTIINTEATQAPIITEEVAGELIKVKENTKKEYQEYIDLYGSETYGITAYILNKVRLYSIPFCFIGIAIGAIFQYVIGVRKLDLRDKGFHLVVAFITILVICQILPLIFAIVVRGWRG